MLLSMELRWFWAGTVPAAVQQWFAVGTIALQTEAPCTDHDLHLHACDDVGIKQRQSRPPVLADPDFPPLQAEDSFAYPHGLRFITTSLTK